MKYRNTLQKGSVRNVIFREGRVWYGVALEFNIVETGDDAQEVMILLEEAVRGYLASARKNKLNPAILNQKSDPEYERLWLGKNNPKSIPSPIQVHTFSERIFA
jgi:predicted RNase H-like HicB family nuclease